ncbi:nucleotide-binding universal stress UspA family protein [Aquimarina sp. EL_43]|uniref:universal stress protein n=1 Tax=unclassified Aquimarina TaxID=2627091 RepID=UPI0018C9F9D0|nr:MULTISPECIES: universal stress protein [unclassified Aquimarina]MBG6130289.1 nucleotide-binding universal stress UspA family protein [Aquimarina sp. EL_35]MBG6149069.1 nucleotide-binding universal stress UspA family protein [Aquimarina sp. EL_32]MBG6168557.1 nucleotide-binding universal stress UspA family protein [Aquimarina sp. EL_43]
MKKRMLKTKYRLLVLIDQTKSSYTALRNAVNLAKVIDAGIEVFYVKSPMQVVQYDNQIAALRTLDEERIASKKAMQKLVDTVSDNENIPIIYSFAFGNVIAEVQSHIAKTNPDIVVIGKRKPKRVNFLRGGLTSYLLKNYKGGILISGNDKHLISGHNVSLGFLDDTSIHNEVGIVQDLKKCTDIPFKLFKIKKTGSQIKTPTAFSQPEEQSIVENTVIFEFEEGMDTSSGLSKYIEKNKLGLLCVKREAKQTLSKSIGFDTKIQQTINKTNVPVLILDN